ncbi:MAG: ABC transporter substrate-binding protein [Desulfovibrionaceae bacterium]|nr:ABC transporter substrate-binding protein [Desulfovibrionaceae bacterium]
MTHTMYHPKLKRCLLSVCFALSLCLFAQAKADAASEAHQALESTVNQVLDELKKPEWKNPAGRDAMQAKVESIILTLFSFEELSMRTVGPNWKNFSPDQKKRFMDAFEDLLRERYLGALEGYNGEIVTYVKETPVGSAGDKVQIDTTVNIKNKTVPVSYRMLRGDGRWMVYDIIIEGVGMVQNYRSQFQVVLQKGDPEELITLVRAKAEETREDNNKKRQSRS